MKHSKLKMIGIFVWMMVFGVFLLRGDVAAKKGDGGYKNIYESLEQNENSIKIGKYYFKYNRQGQDILISTQKNSGFRKTPLPYNAFANGKQAYYIKQNVLYKYDYAKQKQTKIKKIKITGDEYYTISTIYGKQIFITKGSFDQWKLVTYSYNIGNGKWKKVKSDCDILAREGKYVVAAKDYQTDVSAHPLQLFKINGNGLKKVKTLSKYALGCEIKKGYIYYTSYTDQNMYKGSLYRCKLNGTKAKKLVTVSSAKKYGQVMFTMITATNCEIIKDGKTYVYTYASGKMVEKK